MRKLFILSSALLFFTLVAVPKAYSQIEVFGGYSHLALGNNPPNIASGSSGWEAGAYLHLLGPLGFEADYSDHYGISPKVPPKGGRYYVPQFTELYGPRFTLGLPRIHPYAHVLFGSVNGTAELPSGPLSESAVGIDFGAGVNIKATRHVWVRLIQLDYLRAQFTNNTQNDTSFSAGLVFRFGQW